MALKRVNFATAHNASTFTSARWNFQPVPDGFGNAPIQLVEIAPGNPRFAYNPATGEAEGLLIEEQRTNLFTRSSQFIEGQGWARVDGSPMANPPTDFPNSISLGSPEQEELVFGNVGPLAGNTWTISAILSDVSGSIDARFTSTRKPLVKLKDLAGGLSLWAATMNVVSDANLGVTGISCSAGSSLNLHHMQIEQGTFATSPIITNGTAVTRTSDNVERTLGAEFNPNEGTFVVEWYFKNRNDNQNRQIFNIAGGGVDLRLYQYNSDINYRVGGNFAPIGSVSSDGVVRAAVSYINGGEFIAVCSANSGISNPGTISNIQDATTLRIGKLGVSEFLGSTIKIINYKPKSSTESELRELL